MFTSARSYLSRFSGLILFVLAVFVIGLLLAMTISSASNKNSDVSETSEVAPSGASGLTYDQSETKVEEAPLNQTVSVESSSSTSTSYSTSNPQTLAVTEVNLDSQDSVSINTTTTDDTGRVDAPGVATDTAILPDTGPGNVVAGAITLVVTVLGLTYWNKSRQSLSHQLLIVNR